MALDTLRGKLSRYVISNALSILMAIRQTNVEPSVAYLFHPSLEPCCSSIVPVTDSLGMLALPPHGNISPAVLAVDAPDFPRKNLLCHGHPVHFALGRVSSFFFA